jgi:hypothetical protein
MTSERKRRWLNFTGLALELVGVLILFRFGMPFRVPTGGAINLILDGRAPQAIALDRVYTIWGYVGLLLLVSGTLLQMWAVMLPGGRDREAR